MKTKNIFNLLALAMMMPAMLLTTACSSDDDSIINNENINKQNTAKKGYALPVTVKVTRQGDNATTRATYNESTRKLEFSAGDQLFVAGTGHPSAGKFAGTLAMVSEGTFSGTIYTQYVYTGTVDALLTGAGENAAVLLPNGYEDYQFLTISGEGYNAEVSFSSNKAFATTKTAAVEQFSYEMANTYSSGFALSPHNPIFSFTITGLTASTDVAVNYASPYGLINRTVTTNSSGEATFAIGAVGLTNINQCTFIVGCNSIGLGNHELVAGHVYNITRNAAPASPAVALSGKFTVNTSGDQIYFSKGNLQAVCTSADGDASTQETFTWRFAEHQWDYIGGNYSGGALTPTGNNFIDGSGSVSAAGTVDLFSWVGGSSSLTGGAAYGICLWGVGGNVVGEDLKFDWGSIFGGSWRMPSKDEWNYVINTRSTTSGVRYAKAKVNGVSGIILLPDDWNTSYYTLKSTNTSNAAFSANNINASTWTNSLEAHGAVFLPAAGDRSFGSIWNQNSYGTYWSNSSDAENAANAYSFRFSKEDGVQTQYAANRGYGVSVRLICPVHP